jgi:hypothetical protein
MKNDKPKGKTPSLIGSSNGRPEKILVKGKSECNRCGCSIFIGDDCFGIPKSSSGFSSIKRYCKVCFQRIIDQTCKDIEEIKKFL